MGRRKKNPFNPIPELEPEQREDKALALLSQGIPVGTIARRVGLSTRSIEDIKAAMPSLTAQADMLRDSMSSMFYILAEEALNHINDNKLAKMSALDLAKVASLGVEKARLMEGKPTEIILAYQAVIEKYMKPIEAKATEEDVHDM